MNRFFQGLAWLLALSFFVAPDAGAQPAPTTTSGWASGQIKAVKPRGEVRLLAPESGSQPQPLPAGGAVQVGETVITGPKSSVILLFSNGSAVNVGPESQVLLQTFRQGSAPVRASATLRRGEEPSPSETELVVPAGEVSVSVRKLKPDSIYRLQTPAGAAGVRGTTFRVLYRERRGGGALYRLAVGSGEVIWERAGHSPVAVPAGQELALQFAPGSETPTTPPATQPLPPSVALALELAVEETRAEERREEQAGTLPEPPGAPAEAPGEGTDSAAAETGESPAGAEGARLPPPLLPAPPQVTPREGRGA